MHRAIDLYTTDVSDRAQSLKVVLTSLSFYLQVIQGDVVGAAREVGAQTLVMAGAEMRTVHKMGPGQEGMPLSLQLKPMTGKMTNPLKVDAAATDGVGIPLEMTEEDLTETVSHHKCYSIVTCK